MRELLGGRAEKAETLPPVGASCHTQYCLFPLLASGWHLGQGVVPLKGTVGPCPSSPLPPDPEVSGVRAACGLLGTYHAQLSGTAEAGLLMAPAFRK